MDLGLVIDLKRMAIIRINMQKFLEVTKFLCSIRNTLILHVTNIREVLDLTVKNDIVDRIYD